MMPLFPDDDHKLAALRAEHHARHGAAIAYIQRQVGAGAEYANELARAVLSEAGAYFQLTEMPEEFVGALGGDISHQLLSPPEAEAAMERLEALVRAVAEGTVPARSVSLYVLYAGGSLRSRREMFVFDFKQGDPAPFAHGTLLPGRVPRVFKLRLHLEADAERAGFPANGTHFFLAPGHTDGGQCLLATITRTPDTRDLGTQPASPHTLRMN